MKTAKEVLSTNPNWSESDPDVIDAMKIYARQVAEAVREAMIPLAKTNERANFNIEQFIK